MSDHAQISPHEPNRAELKAAMLRLQEELVRQAEALHEARRLLETARILYPNLGYLQFWGGVDAWLAANPEYIEVKVTGHDTGGGTLRIGKDDAR